MTTDTKSPEKKLPVHKLKDGLMTATIWDRKTEKGTFYSVTFDRRYTDKDGNWKSSDSYDTGDLLALAKLADLAHTWIVTAQAKDPA